MFYVERPDNAEGTIRGTKMTNGRVRTTMTQQELWEIALYSTPEFRPDVCRDFGEAVKLLEQLGWSVSTKMSGAA